MNKYIPKVLLVVFLASFFVALTPAQAAPATLFLSPGSGTYDVGKSFSLKVMVNSGGEPGVNAAEGQIKFDPSIVTVSGINDAGSIFKLWTTDPTFSNGNGTITFGGGAPGSYKGSSGLIFTVVMTSKKAGTADLTWTSGIVLAADGKGTNVFGSYGHGKYTIEIAETKEEPEEKPKTETTEQPEKDVKGILPPLPDISSKTHPDEETWYTNPSPEFAWKVLSELTGVSYDVTSDPKSDPGAENDGIVENTKIENQEDGEWYFHIKYQNRYGFGQTAHRKFKVDRTPPEDFVIALDNNNDPTNPTPKLRFKTEDKASGISYYMTQTGIDKTKISVDEMKSGYYQLGPVKPGQYTTLIAAFDLAGNSASSTITYIIEPLKSPVITDVPKVIDRKKELIIRGTSFYPQVKVRVYIDNGEIFKEYITTTDDEGNWSYFHGEKIEKGNYEVYARVIDDRGAESLDSTHHLLTVQAPSIIDAYGLWIIILLLIIIISLILFILYREQQYNDEKKRIKAETEEVKSKLSKIFSALREEVDELIELADKKPGLSEAERRIKEKLQESLDISEEFIAKEVEDVEKEIKLKKSKRK